MENTILPTGATSSKDQTMVLTSSHLCRLDVVYLDNYRLALFEVRIAAGEPEEIYENAMRKVS